MLHGLRGRTRRTRLAHESRFVILFQPAPHKAGECSTLRPFCCSPPVQSAKPLELKPPLAPVLAYSAVR